MSSSNKTDFLNLNEWVLSDIPNMQDFNSDNQKIDEALSNHLSDDSIHISEETLSRISSPFTVGSYVGDDSEERTITLEFVPKFGIIFPNNNASAIYMDSHNSTFQYFGFFTPDFSTLGISLSQNNLKVIQFEGSASQSMPTLNKIDVTYTYIIWK